MGMPSGGGGKTVALGTRIGWDSSLSIAITSVMMSIAWLTRVSPAPCIRIVASETSSRRLHTSLVTIHSCDVSFRAFRRCCRKYSLIGFFKARRRSILLNWLVYVLVGSCFARGKVVGGGSGGGRRGRGRRYRFFNVLYFYLCDGNRTRPKGHQT